MSRARTTWLTAALLAGAALTTGDAGAAASQPAPSPLCRPRIVNSYTGGNDRYFVKFTVNGKTVSYDPARVRLRAHLVNGPWLALPASAWAGIDGGLIPGTIVTGQHVAGHSLSEADKIDLTYSCVTGTTTRQISGG